MPFDDRFVPQHQPSRVLHHCLWHLHGTQTHTRALSTTVATDTRQAAKPFRWTPERLSNRQRARSTRKHTRNNLATLSPDFADVTRSSSSSHSSTPALSSRPPSTTCVRQLVNAQRKTSAHKQAQLLTCPSALANACLRSNSVGVPTATSCAAVNGFRCRIMASSISSRVGGCIAFVSATHTLPLTKHRHPCKAPRTEACDEVRIAGKRVHSALDTCQSATPLATHRRTLHPTAPAGGFLRRGLRFGQLGVMNLLGILVPVVRAKL